MSSAFSSITVPSFVTFSPFTVINPSAISVSALRREATPHIARYFCNRIILFFLVVPDKIVFHHVFKYAREFVLDHARCYGNPLVTPMFVGNFDGTGKVLCLE